jgi:hypothetical protein
VVAWQQQLWASSGSSMARADNGGGDSFVQAADRGMGGSSSMQAANIGMGSNGSSMARVDNGGSDSSVAAVDSGSGSSSMPAADSGGGGTPPLVIGVAVEVGGVAGVLPIKPMANSSMVVPKP